MSWLILCITIAYLLRRLFISRKQFIGRKYIYLNWLNLFYLHFTCFPPTYICTAKDVEIVEISEFFSDDITGAAAAVPNLSRHSSVLDNFFYFFYKIINYVASQILLVGYQWGGGEASCQVVARWATVLRLRTVSQYNI